MGVIDTSRLFPAEKIFDLEGARKAGIPEDKIFDRLKSTHPDFDFDKAIASKIPIDRINNHVSSIINQPQGNVEVFKKSMVSAKDTALDTVIPMAGTGAAIAASPIVTPVGGAAASIGLMSALHGLYSDAGLAKRRSTLADVLGTDKGGVGEKVANSVQIEGLNRALSGITGKVSKYFQNKDVPLNPELEKLKPTFSQIQGKPDGLAARVENIWGVGNKKKALEESAAAIRGESQKIFPTAEGASGRIQNAGKAVVNSLNRKFTGGKDIVEALGIGNATPDFHFPAQLTGSRPTGLMDSFGKPAMQEIYSDPVVVKGIKAPVYLKNTIEAAKNFLNEQNTLLSRKGYVVSDDEKKLVDAAETILGNTNGGRLPTTFRNAVDILHGVDGTGGANSLAQKGVGEVSRIKDVYSKFANALDSDIEGSVGKWQKGGDQALDAYRNAKDAMLQKAALLKGKPLVELIKDGNPVKAIDMALSDPKETQRLLNAGNLNSIPSTNMRQDLGSYKFAQIMKNADNGKGGFDPGRLTAEWNNPDFAKTKDLIYSKTTQKEIGTFLENAARVSDPGASGKYQQIRLTMHGIGIGTGLVGSLLSGSGMHAFAPGAIFASAEIPMYMVGKMLANPQKALVLNRLISGAPLDTSMEKAGRLLMSGLTGTIKLIDNQGNAVEKEIKGGEIK